MLRPSPALRSAIVAIGLAQLLAGCRLVDQRTFEATPSGPRAAQLNRPDLPPLPLVTIGLTVPDLDWRPAVQQAVIAAESRKPGVAFDVVTPIPTSATQSVQDLYLKNGQQDGQMVARELQSDGIPPDRIGLRFQGDPGAPPREVRIYAR
jgi:hypothetical protein